MAGAACEKEPVLLGAFALMVGQGVHIHWIIVSFGVFISLAMTVIWRRRRNDEVR